MQRVAIRSQSCKEKSLYPNYADPLVWFPFHCLSLFYSCAFSWKLLREATPWRHAKKMSKYNYITEQCFWKRTQPWSLLVFCFLPLKAVCLLSKSRSPQHQLSLSFRQSAQWHWPGKCMQNCVPSKNGRCGQAVREWCPGGARPAPASSPEPACLMSYILQSRWGTEPPSIGFFRNLL